MAKFEGVTVKLIGEDGNALSILARCTKAARRAGIEPERIDEFNREAMAGDYSHLLSTVMDYFEDGDVD